MREASEKSRQLVEVEMEAVPGGPLDDLGHAPKDQSNRRSHLPAYA